MNKTALIKRVSQQHQREHITQHVYNQVLTELLAGIRQELAAGRKVSFLGFGTFYTRIRKASKGRHFKTKKIIDVPQLRIPAFRAGSLLKKAVRRKK